MRFSTAPFELCKHKHCSVGIKCSFAHSESERAAWERARSGNSGDVDISAGGMQAPLYQHEQFVPLSGPHGFARKMYAERFLISKLLAWMGKEDIDGDIGVVGGGGGMSHQAPGIRVRAASRIHLRELLDEVNRIVNKVGPDPEQLTLEGVDRKQLFAMLRKRTDPLCAWCLTRTRCLSSLRLLPLPPPVAPVAARV
jgi:hypothetical protein